MAYNVYATIRNNLDVELHPAKDHGIANGTITYALQPIIAGGQGAFQIKANIDDKKGSKGYVKYIADIGHAPTEVKFHFEVNSGGDARASITSSDSHLITTQTTGVSPSDHPLRPVYTVGRAPGSTRSATSD